MLAGNFVHVRRQVRACVPAHRCASGIQNFEGNRGARGGGGNSSDNSNGGQNCVEVAGNGVILVRDTTNRDGVTLSVPAAAWAKFTASLR